MRLEFHGEAYDTYQRIVDSLTGMTVQIAPDPQSKEAVIAAIGSYDDFDAVLLGVDHDAGWANAVRVRRFDEEQGGAVGDEFGVIVETITVY